MKRQCRPVYYAFDLLWLNGRDLRELSLLERKKILRKVIPRKSNSVGCVSYVDKDALKLFELVKKSDLEGLVVKRKDGKYAQQTLWYKILNPTYTESRSAGICSTAVNLSRSPVLRRSVPDLRGRHPQLASLRSGWSQHLAD